MRAVSVVLSLLMIVGAGVGQTANATIQPNTIQVGAEGKFEAAPDTVVIQFNLAAQEKNARAAYQRVSTAAEQVRSLLRSNQFDPRQAHVGFYSQEPVYDWRTPEHKLVGYRVSTTVELKLKDFAKVGPIVEQLASIDTAGSQSISYTLEEMEAAKSKAVQDAFRHARSEAEALAQAGGRALGELIYASIDTIERPVFPMMARSAMAKAGAVEQAPTEQFTPQTVTITAHVNAVFALR